MGDASRVLIGMDPHKRTVTIEAMAAGAGSGTVHYGHGRVRSDAGLRVAVARSGVGAVEGCEGIGLALGREGRESRLGRGGFGRSGAGHQRWPLCGRSPVWPIAGNCLRAPLVGDERSIARHVRLDLPGW
jgi:hypothetical protein